MQQQYRITDPRNLNLRNSSFDDQGLITMTEYLGNTLPSDSNMFQVNCLLSVLQGPNKGVYWNDGTIETPSWNSSNIIRVSYVLSSTEILNLFTNPIKLTPNPGVGKYIIADKVFLKYDFGTVGYNSPGNLNITMGAGNNVFQFGNYLFSGSSKRTQFAPISVIQLQENTALQIESTLGNPTVGDGTLEVIIYYQIATTAF